MFAPNTLHDNDHSILDPTLDSFQHAQHNIEEWIYSNPMIPMVETTGDETVGEENVMCYGTVSEVPPYEVREWFKTEGASHLMTSVRCAHDSQILRSSMKLLGNMLDLDNKLNLVAGSPVAGHAQLNLVRLETQYHVTFPDGSVLGEMNIQLEEALNSVLEQQHTLDFEVFAPVTAIRETIAKATKEKDAIGRVQINVYGTQAASVSVGQELSERKIYLQRPEYVRHGVLYENPHVLKLGSFQGPENISSSDVVEPHIGRQADKVTGVKEVISGVYSSLTRNEHLVALEGDRRLHTPLLSCVLLCYPLGGIADRPRHQMRALDFMTQRENGPIHSDYLLWKPEEKEGLIWYVSCYACVRS